MSNQNWELKDISDLPQRDSPKNNELLIWYHSLCGSDSNIDKKYLNLAPIILLMKKNFVKEKLVQGSFLF